MGKGDKGFRNVDQAIALLAASQEGVISLAQLDACGLGERGAQHRVASGRLHSLFRGVYAVGHPRVSVDGRRIGAVLACGRGAVLSRRSAAAGWGILNTDGRRFDVVAPGRSGGRVGDEARIDLRRTRRLPDDDVTVLRGIPMTTVGRTLLDLSGVVGARVLRRAVHEAEVAGLLDVEAVLATIERNPGRRGTRALRTALGVSAPDPHNGEFANTFFALCLDYGLPSPQLGVHVDGGDRLYEVDALFAAERLIVELDGGQVHRTARNFQTDRRRDSVLAALDYQTLRYTWHRLREEPAAIAGELRRVLALRSLRAA
jgi:very-short-patch-repair endonuclease